MGLFLSLQTVYEAARITMPSFAEAVVGRLERDTADERLQSFGRRVVARADMKLEVEGRDRVPVDRAFVYMSNHQSHLDIPVLYATVPTRTLRMVAKAELFRIPFWRRSLSAAGFIEVDRADHAKAVASIERAKEQIRNGVSVWIAPEGSRSRSGRLAALKKGGFHLALGTDTPIVPVAISGTRDALPPGTTRTRPGCRIKVVFGAPVPVEGRTIPELMAEVERFLLDHIEV